MGATRNGSQSTLPSGPPPLGEQGAASSRIGPYSYVEDVYEKLPTTLELEKMLARDTQPRALENALVLPVRQAPFEIEKAEGDTREARYVREILLKPSYQGGMTTPISAVIAQMTGAFARRRTFFEKVWEIGPDGKYTYHKLAFRRASTCSIIDDKNGSFNGFKQEGFLKDGTPFKKEFNPSKAFVFIHGFAPDDPLKGESAFDAAYQAHVNKMKIQFLQAMYLQKFGLPQTIIETDSLNEVEQKKALAIGEELQGGGVAVFGPTMRLASQNLNSTSNAGDFKEALEYLDNQMARSVLAQFLLLGQGSNTGAWALSKDHSDFFVISEEARLRQIEWHFDNYVIAPLVYYNFGESASYPKLKFRPLSESAIERSLEMFKDLVARGQMTPKPALVEAIEEKVAQVLDVDPDKLKEEEAVTSPTDNSPVNPEIQRAVDRLNIPSAQPVAASLEDEAIEPSDDYVLLEIETDDGETIDLHLPGRHNQKDHGRLGIGHKGRRSAGLKGSGSSSGGGSSGSSSGSSGGSSGPGGSSGAGSGSSGGSSGGEQATAPDAPTPESIEAAGMNEWPEKDDAAHGILGDASDTQEMHSIPTSDGGRAYTPERTALHDQIINDIIGGATPPADGQKKALFMGGGTASGKSSALKLNPQVIPENAVTIDPDEMKAKLPEYNALTDAGSKYNAMAAHEESSDLAKRLRKEASDRGLNVVVDGTGDSRPGKFAGKIRDAINDGYRPSVFYVNAPTEVAIPRAIGRAQKTGRFVPIPEIRNQHRGVSANFPEVAELPGVGNLYLYQTEGDPELIATGEDGTLDIKNQDLYDQFLEKANE